MNNLIKQLNKMKRSYVVICCAMICLLYRIKNVEAQSSVSVPVGAMLPSDDSVIDSVFKLALSKHNSMVAPLSQSRDLKENTILRFRVFLQQVVVNDSFLITQEFCRQVSNNVHAIIGYSDSKTFSSMISYSNTFNIPWISPSLPEEKSNSPFLIVMHPRIDRFVLSFITSMGWKKLTLVYDKKEILLSMPRILDFGQKNKIDVNVRNIGRDATIYQVLREIACAEEHHIIFDVGTEKAIQILESIEAMGMLSVEYHYLFTDESLVYTDSMPYGSGGTANLTFISIEQPKNEANNRFRQEMYSMTNSKTPFPSFYHGSSLVYDAFTVMSLGIQSMLDVGYRLNIQSGSDPSSDNVLKCQQSPAPTLVSGIDIANAIKAVKFEGLTGNVEFNENGERTNYVINIHSLSRMGMNVVGKWTDSNNELGVLEVNGTIRHEEILKSLQNETLVITTILEEPYATLKSNADELTGNDRYEGFCVDLIAEITKIFPFQYKIKPVDDGQYGSKNDADNTWNGMIGEVKYQKAHMAVAPLTITSSREAVVEFTKPFMSLGISVMIKKPEKQTAHIFSFMEPLSYEIWICIVFAYIGVSVVLYLVSRFSPYEWHRRSILPTEENDEIVDSATDFGIMNSLWFSLGAFVQQGCDISPKSVSGRIVGGVWWLFTLIIISSYTANLAAFLTVDRMVSPISGAEDLAQQNIIKYGTLKSGSTVAFFKKSPLPTFEKMWAFMKSQEPSVFVKSNKDGIARVRESDGKYAFLMESTLNDYTEQRKPCNTLKVGPNIDSKGYGIALPKGSPIYDSINLAILTLREQGRLQKMKNYWWYDKSECGPNGNSAPTKTPALALSNVTGVFYILIGGMGMAIVVAVAEFFYFIAAKQRKERREFQNRQLRNHGLDKKNAKKLGVKFDVPYGGDKESIHQQDLLGLT